MRSSGHLGFRQALAMVILLTVGMTAAKAAADDFAALNEVVVSDYLLPRYEAFAVAGQSLEEALRQDCTDRRLDAAASKAAFHDMMDAWMGVQHLRFGMIVGSSISKVSLESG